MNKRRLIIYGDSYSDDRHPNSWPKQLRNQDKYDVHCFAVNGSSIEFSFYKFIIHVREKFFKKDDVIIFQCSSPGRLFFNHQIFERPTSAVYHTIPRHMVLESDPNTKWYIDNEDYVKWYLINRNEELILPFYFNMIRALRDFAEDNKDTLVMVLQLRMPTKPAIPIKSLDNFLITYRSLLEISNSESDVDHFEFTKYTNGWDLKVNHLTKPNIEIFVNLINKAIDDRTLVHFDTASFHQYIIQQMKCFDDYKMYVDRGILYEIPGTNHDVFRKI